MAVNYKELRDFAERMPLVADRAMVEIVNGVETAVHLTEFRQSRRYLQRRLDRLTGADRSREIQATQALVRAQKHLADWVAEQGGHLTFTNLNLAIVAARVEDLGERSTVADASAREALSRVGLLAEKVADWMDDTGRRIADIELRQRRHETAFDDYRARSERELLRLRLWQNARDTADDTMRAWTHRGAYRELPWVCQVPLLARQFAGGEVGEHESVTGDKRWRRRLAEDILASRGTEAALARYGWERRRRAPLRDVLARSLAELPDSDLRGITAELLGWGLPDHLRPRQGPIGEAVALTMAYGADAADSAPGRDGETDRTRGETAERADADARREIPDGHKYLTPEEFVRWAVAEQADGAHRERLRLHRRAVERIDGDKDQGSAS